jgi:uncharacterized protein
MKALDKNEIIQYLRANKQFLEEHFGVTKIALFGSYARDEATADSDIDLLVEMNEEDFTIRFYLKEHLEKQFNRKVDVGYFKSLRLFVRRNVESDLIYA